MDSKLQLISHNQMSKHHIHHEHHEEGLPPIHIFIENIVVLEEEHNRKKQRVRLVLTKKIKKSKFIIMALQLNQNQFSLDSLALIDSDTGLEVAATFANQAFSSDNEAVLTSVIDPSNPNQTKDTAVSAGSANVTASADATYIDSLSGQQVTKSLTVVTPYTVVAVTAGENVALILKQGTPQLQ